MSNANLDNERLHVQPSSRYQHIVLIIIKQYISQACKGKEFTQIEMVKPGEVNKIAPLQPSGQFALSQATAA